MSRGLYIHVPFCVRKCRYCDFFSVTDISLAESYVRSVIRNISALKESFSTVYFGGGTPSLLSAEQISSILSAAEIKSGAEVSMEVNPGTAGESYFREIKAAGVNRISFGIQSFNDKELSALGRIHKASEAVSAVFSAGKAGFENISGDIMLAVPFQTENSLRETLEKAVSLPLTHISAYLLKVEEGTPLSKDRALLEALPSEDETADMYLETVDFLEDHGFEQYEISNFSKNGFECRHNLKYWRCEEYRGIGVSAHGFANGERYRCGDTIESFINSPLQRNIPTGKGGDPEERAMLALRITKEGIPVTMFPSLEKRSEQLIKSGLARLENGFLKLTPKGCLVSNQIIIYCTEQDGGVR